VPRFGVAKFHIRTAQRNGPAVDVTVTVVPTLSEVTVGGQLSIGDACNIIQNLFPDAGGTAEDRG
jgi:hypothetical protein